MEVKEGMLAFRRRLSHNHHERQQKPIEVVIFPSHRADHLGQVFSLLALHVRQRSEVPARIDLHLGWETGREWDEREECLVLSHDPVPLFDFALQDPAVEASLFPLDIGASRTYLLFRQRRGEWECVDLAMWVR